MFYTLFTLTTLFYYNVNALVTVLCNNNLVCSGDHPICIYLTAGCVLYDNGEFKMAQHNTYPITYSSGGFDQNGYHVEYYFGKSYQPASIGTPNGNSWSMLRPANPGVGDLYFAFLDKPVQDAANDARSACYNLNQWVTIALPCDSVYETALREYKQAS